MISAEQSIPVRGPAGLAARDIFFEQFNDVNFYIEDEDQENLYLEILKTLFPKLQITQIFPLRGKANVLAHAHDPVNARNAPKSVYLLDKDFDDLLGHIDSQENIFYLDRYCIENFLCEEDAVVQLVLEADPKLNKTKLKKAVDYQKFHGATVRALDPLFRVFFVVQRFNLGIKNTDIKAETFSAPAKPWEIDNTKVETYAADVRERIAGTAVFQSVEDYEKFLASAFPKGGPADAHISGKYLLSLTYHYLKSNHGIGNVTGDSMRYRLARNCELRPLRPLGTRITQFLGKDKT